VGDGDKMIRNINRNRAVPLCFLTDLFKVAYDLLSVVDDLKQAGVEIEHDQRVQYAFEVMSRITGVVKPKARPITVTPMVQRRQPVATTHTPTLENEHALASHGRRAGDYHY
jgi:hypothetical protein